MKNLISLIVFSMLFLACDDGSGISEEMLQPKVRIAREFLEHLKNDEQSQAMALVNFYDINRTSDSVYNRWWDSVYASIKIFVNKHDLKPISKWRVMKDEFRSASGKYVVSFENVLVPLVRSAEGDDDPVYLNIGFENSCPQGIHGLEIITKKMCDGSCDKINFVHMLSAKQERRLRTY